MKTDLGTFWDGFASVPDKCRKFEYKTDDPACRTCPGFHACKFMRKLMAELLEEKPITEALYLESTTDCEKGYWSGYLQGLQRVLDGTAPTRIKELLGG